MLVGSSARAAPPPEPEGYRLSDYKAPVPATLKGARVVDTERAFELWAKDAAAFIDVLPQAPRPANLPAQTIWRDKPRGDIPHSLWLPDTGYGELHPSMLAYFRAGLERPRAAINPRRSSSIALPIAGNPGMRPSVPFRSAIPR